ncbi:MAG TPA: GNAT family N-acetyltransferase [Pseudonocardiaceae bacterium]|nr:GNAT family N-acetyltransferase [Pseudonocardiaceae bacterium]
MIIRIEPARPADVDALVGLLTELAVFYGTDSRPDVDETEDALFGDLPAATVLLAWAGADLAGMAAYTYLWPAVGTRRSLYLKELFVAGEHRQSGVGRRLMAALFEIAEQRGCSRVEWTADQGNTAAQRFYAELGAAVLPTKLFYRSDLR